jgi:hypothetical protein
MPDAMHPIAAAPRTIAAELATAHRVLANLASSADRSLLARYIEELEAEQARMDWEAMLAA